MESLLPSSLCSPFTYPTANYRRCAPGTRSRQPLLTLKHTGPSSCHSGLEDHKTCPICKFRTHLFCQRGSLPSNSTSLHLQPTYSIINPLNRSNADVDHTQRNFRTMGAKTTWSLRRPMNNRLPPRINIIRACQHFRPYRGPSFLDIQCDGINALGGLEQGARNIWQMRAEDRTSILGIQPGSIGMAP